MTGTYLALKSNEKLNPTKKKKKITSFIHGLRSTPYMRVILGIVTCILTIGTLDVRFEVI